ncbi:Penicillin-binding protein 4* [Polaribacter huanghezhanensis]|uniref:serine hydrolase domain-containing protein n=1 Tax=Polaribacter huanghezhanensis TaxID=1354726 RepID=UPI0026489347|nr:serine hydrolase domain-containing protein [Polaribacter huanghezhanensis]WKD86157.1 Penicillin-binding protein 4* [Polaribacter huanghezhanensis]
MIKVFLSIIAFLMSLFAAGQVIENSKLSIENKVDILFKDIKDTDPGVSVGIIKGNKFIVQKNYGLANLEYQIPITNSTVFHTASVSKQFTAFAILLLEADGKLSLEDDIRKYIPELHQFEKKITLRQLANHTSGIRDQHNLARMAGWNSDDIITNRQVLELIYKQKNLNFAPNEQFMYSNSGYTLLAEVVARVSKKSFADFTKERIFIPLKMNQTQFTDKVGLLIKNKAYSYYKENNNFIKNIFQNASVGATNLSTSLYDLSKWAINFTTYSVGSKKIFEKMQQLGKLNNGNSYDYGLGLFINNYKGIPKIEHSGLDASYQAYIGWFPKQNMSIIFLSNNGELNGGRIINKLTGICLDSFVKQKKKVSKKLTKKNTYIKVDLNNFKKQVGFYWNYKDRFTRELRINNGHLNYVGGDGKLTKLNAVNKNEYEFSTKEYTAVKIDKTKMNVILDDGYTLKFEKYIPANYNEKSIKEFTGTYYSEELNTTYTFYSKENRLIANHQRTGDFKLKAIKNAFFIGNKGSFRDITFTRNKNYQITGFKVSSSRAKNIIFRKLNSI